MGYTFRLASIEDKDAIISFLAENWNKDHIFVKDEALFLWQYHTPGTSGLNFLLAENDKTGTIDSLLGFIPVSHFDPALEAEGNLWGAIWKTAKGKGIVGLYALKKMQEITGSQSYSGISISEESRKIYEHLDYKMDAMEHYFIALPGDGKKIMIAPNPVLPEQVYPDARIETIDGESLLSMQVEHPGPPRKSAVYLYHRYATHPVYRYRFHRVIHEKKTSAILVSRLIRVPELDACCLRIVDWLGDWNAPLDYRAAFLEILSRDNAEYVDLLCNVGAPGHFTQHGFRLKNPDEEIVPNYFEPFVQANIPLLYVYHGVHPTFNFFKGDADQDRPNVRP